MSLIVFDASVFASDWWICFLQKLDWKELTEIGLEGAFPRYIDVKDPIGSKLLFLSPIRSRKGAYPLKTIILRDSDIKR